MNKKLKVPGGGTNRLGGPTQKQMPIKKSAPKKAMKKSKGKGGGKKRC